MRVAALSDIHGNLPALDAVLKDIREIGVDRIVVGGDVLPGPMPRETMDRLLGLEIPTQFVYGNGELAMLAQLTATDPSAVTYWGTTGGFVLPEPMREMIRWSAQQVREYQDTRRLGAHGHRRDRRHRRRAVLPRDAAERDGNLHETHA
jgi:Icc-related predicted phosphoesterase